MSLKSLLPAPDTVVLRDMAADEGRLRRLRTRADPSLCVPVGRAVPPEAICVRRGRGKRLYMGQIRLQLCIMRPSGPAPL